jgi:hypothetical protein
MILFSTVQLSQNWIQSSACVSVAFWLLTIVLLANRDLRTLPVFAAYPPMARPAF